MRKDIANSIVGAFIKANAALYLLIFLIVIIDQYNAANGISETRIFGESALITVIGATVVQLGAISLGISKWLFPDGK